MAKYVVAGVTGRVGSVVAEELLARGERPTVIVRDSTRAADWSKRRATAAVGSLEDELFLSRTLDGADGFFMLLPENVPPHEFHEARRRMADAVAVAVAKRGVRHVAMLSAIAAVLPDGNRPAKDLHYCENRLRACGATLRALRACYFQDNVASVLTPSGADPAHSGDLSPSTGASIGSLGCLEFIREDPDADIRAVAVSVPLQPVG